MSQPEPFFAAAFFDAPGLLAIRFSRHASSRPAASFAAFRRPDTPAINLVTVARVAGFGLLIAFFSLPLLRGNAAAGTSSGGNPPVVSSPSPLDSAGSSSWAEGLDRLADDLSPSRADLQPWMVRTLLDVPRELARSGSATGGATGGWLKPRCSPEDRAAYAQGERFARMLEAIGADRQLAVILDLPGPTSIAVATGLAQRFDPVFTFDNLPHPAGVVPSAQTLAAVVYWRPQLMAARAARNTAGADNLPPVFVLEGDRLAAYANEVERFDNRSQVRLPDADGLRALGITRVLYVRQHRGNVAEADDLNLAFTALTAGGIDVKHLALDALDEPETQPEQTATAPPTADATDSSRHSTIWFWQRYPWYRPAGRQWSEPDDPDARYQTTPRTTQFSSSFSGSTGAQRYDGGNAHRTEVFQRLVPPPPSAPSSSGSWSRSSHHSSSG